MILLFASLYALAAPTAFAFISHDNGAEESNGGRPEAEELPSQFTLFNGEASAVKVVFHFITPSGSHCTGTMVGKKVAATAAHCLGQSFTGTTTVTATIDGRSVQMRCQQAPSWPGNTDLDIAACQISEEVSFPTACIGAPPSVNSPIELIGHGTSNNADGEGFFDEEQRRGKSVLRATGGSGGRPSHMDISGNKVAGGPGDSGGFAGFKDESGKWILNGVISRSSAFRRQCVPASRIIVVDGRQRCETPGSKLKTFFVEGGGTTAVNLQVPAAQEFYRNFARTNNVEICGINPNGSGGGGGVGPTPLPPGTPVADRQKARRDFRLGITPRTGIRILPNSAIGNAGLKSGDTITAVNGVPVRSLQELAFLVNQLKANPFVNQITISAKSRDGASRDMTVNLPPVNNQNDLFRRQFFRLGIAVNGGGVSASEVASGGIGERIGIRQGELICSVNGNRVASTQQLVFMVERLRENLAVPRLNFGIGQGTCNTTRQVSVDLP